MKTDSRIASILRTNVHLLFRMSKAIIGFILFSLLCNPLLVAESYFDNYSMSLGIEHKIMVIMIDENEGEAEAEFKQDVFSPSITLNSPTGFIMDSNVGYNIFMNLSQFRLNKQQVSGKSEDLGTHIEGTFYYLIPSLFYVFGNTSSNSFLKLGAGLGLSGAALTGSVQFDADNPTEDPKKISYNDTSRIANCIFIEAKLGSFLLGFNKRSPKLIGDEYNYILNDISIYIFYNFLF